MNDKLTDLRQQWLAAKQAGDTKTMEKIERIGKAIKNGELCRLCPAIASFDGYFCTEEHKTAYWPPSKGRPSIDYLRKRLREMARDAHLKNPQGRLDI